MDAKQVALEVELAEHLQRAAEVASRLQKLEQGRGTPHYDQIESAAHEVGQRPSRMVQQTPTGDIAIEQAREAACPDCRNKCPVETVTRHVTSTDGPVEITETIAYCTRCRRSFFSLSVRRRGWIRGNRLRGSSDNSWCSMRNCDH